MSWRSPCFYLLGAGITDWATTCDSGFHKCMLDYLILSCDSVSLILSLFPFICFILDSCYCPAFAFQLTDCIFNKLFIVFLIYCIFMPPNQHIPIYCCYWDRLLCGLKLDMRLTLAFQWSCFHLPSVNIPGNPISCSARERTQILCMLDRLSAIQAASLAPSNVF